MEKMQSLYSEEQRNELIGHEAYMFQADNSYLYKNPQQDDAPYFVCYTRKDGCRIYSSIGFGAALDLSEKMNCKGVELSLCLSDTENLSKNDEALIFYELSNIYCDFATAVFQNAHLRCVDASKLFAERFGCGCFIVPENGNAIPIKGMGQVINLMLVPVSEFDRWECMKLCGNQSDYEKLMDRFKNSLNGKDPLSICVGNNQIELIATKDRSLFS